MSYQGTLVKTKSINPQSMLYSCGEETQIKFIELPQCGRSFVFIDESKGVVHTSSVTSFNINFENKKLHIETINSMYIVKINPPDEKKYCLTFLEARILETIVDITPTISNPTISKKEIKEILSNLMTKLK